jgi:hypothetical protein
MDTVSETSKSWSLHLEGSLAEETGYYDDRISARFAMLVAKAKRPIQGLL